MKTDKKIKVKKPKNLREPETKTRKTKNNKMSNGPPQNREGRVCVKSKSITTGVD
jgi:hypothetical protein